MNWMRDERSWSETCRWSAWVNTDPQGRNGGDAVEVGRFLTRAEAEAKVHENRRGGFVDETVVSYMGEYLRWDDVRPGTRRHWKMRRVFRLQGEVNAPDALSD